MNDQTGAATNIIRQAKVNMISQKSMVTKAGTVQWFIVKREYNCGQRADPTSRLPIPTDC